MAIHKGKRRKEDHLNMASTHMVAASGDEPAVVQILGFCKRNWFILLPLFIIIRFLYYRYSSPLRHYPGPFLASGSRLWKVLSTYSGKTETDHILLHEKYSPTGCGRKLSRGSSEGKNNGGSGGGGGNLVRIAPNELSLSSPLAAREVLAAGKGFHKTDFYAVFPPPENPDIFTETRESVHAVKKRYASHAYSMSAMQQLSGCIEATERLLVEKLEGVASAGLREGEGKGGGVVDLGDYLHYFAFDVLGEVAFSRKFGFLDAGADLEGAIETIDEMQWYDGIVGQIPEWDWVFRRNPLWKLVPGLDPARFLITRMAREEMEKRKRIGEKEVESGRKDLLSQLMAAHEKAPGQFGEGDVFAVAHGAIFAGSDSTASTMQSFCHFVLSRPQVHARLKEEIDEAWQGGRLSAMPQWNEVQALPYFQACLKEAMRLRPAVGLNITRLTPPGGAEIDGQQIPGGVRIALNAWVLHRNEDVFGPDAKVYKPERWLEDAEKAKAMERCMFQFGGGSHLCIGKNLALLEMNKLLPLLFRDFEMELVHPGKELKYHSTFFVVQSGLEMSSDLAMLCERSTYSTVLFGDLYIMFLKEKKDIVELAFKMRLSEVILTISLAATRALSFDLFSNSFGVPGVNATYDYVVIGGGTAGLTIAARLAEDANLSVAVVEAGGFYQMENGNGSVIPSLCITQFVGSSQEVEQPLIDWNFDTTPQAGAAGRRMRYARGKTLGGSSARNYMAYHRGTTGSYQKWADQVDDQSFTLPNLLKYFQRSTSLTPPNTEARFDNGTVYYDAGAFSNRTGFHQPLQLTWTNWAYPIASWARLGLEAIGIQTSTTGFNSGTLNGSSWNPVTVDPVTQHRSSSQTSFLEYAMKSSSLKVYPRAFTRQIIFDANKTAIGITVQAGQTNFTLNARKEVILSAGAFQSPQLLMVSGVGPENTLSQYNIPCVKHLPGVGQNMQDQPFFGIDYRVNVETSSMLVNDPQYHEDAVQKYLENATGPLANSPGFIAFERISQNQPSLLSNSTIEALNDNFPDDWPEAEYLVGNGYSGYNRNYRTADPGDGYNYAAIYSALISPFSKGNLTISSPDMAVQPVINPNWLTDSRDKELAMAMFKRIREIWANMRNVTIGEEYLPGPNVTTDEQIMEYIQESVIQIYHAAATCKMGRSDDSMAVVDSRARVYGVKNLRVVDAAAFPFLTPGHPQSGVYMLAEKIAEDIRLEREERIQTNY
ncbi:GMC oxidoreductase [Hortaea werneckii]|nr:GMC oxidoreductase [Hortaea werneckii]